MSREFAEDEPELDFAARFILDEIGIEFEEPDADRLDSIIDKFDGDFPKTVEFSALARLTLAEVRAEDDPDTALVEWLSHEEALFRRLERRIVAKRLEEGFVDKSGATDVDGFVRFSLSVQNRRKSRMGQSLEHTWRRYFEPIISRMSWCCDREQPQAGFSVSQRGSLPVGSCNRLWMPEHAGGQIVL